MYFINTNWKHLQLLMVTFITLEIHGTDFGSALHISSRVLRTWLQGHTTLLSLTHVVTSQSCPPKVSPALPFLAPGSLAASKPGHTGGACHLLHCQQRKVCCSLGGCEAVGCSHGLAGHSQRHCVSPGAGLLMALLQDTPGQWPCQGPHGPHGPQAQLTRSWVGPTSGCRAVPRGALWVSPPDTLCLSW